MFILFYLLNTRLKFKLKIIKSSIPKFEVTTIVINNKGKRRASITIQNKVEANIFQTPSRFELSLFIKNYVSYLSLC